MKLCFVILHYLTDDDTIECINSILNLNGSADIVVVDNNSNNGSIEIVESTFKEINNIKFIYNKNNLGFAKGNNIGYEYAKDGLKSNMIVVTNNDTVFNDIEFIDKLHKSYEENKFFIMGPDIVSMIDGGHQNPMSGNCLSSKEAFMEEVRYSLLFLLSKLGLYDLLKKNKNNSNSNNLAKYVAEKKENVILHGSCIVFSELYIEKMKYAFYPETFLYMEEMILFQLCIKNGFKIIYEPSLKVLHKEDSSTNKLTSSNKKKREFVFTNMAKSLRIYRKCLR